MLVFIICHGELLYAVFFYLLDLKVAFWYVVIVIDSETAGFIVVQAENTRLECFQEFGGAFYCLKGGVAVTLPRERNDRHGTEQIY